MKMNIIFFKVLILLSIFLMMIKNRKIKKKNSKKLKKSGGETRWDKINPLLTASYSKTYNAGIKTIAELEAKATTLKADKSEKEFKFSEFSTGSGSNPTIIAGLIVLHKLGVLTEEKIPKASNILGRIESFYNDIPYHNKFHPADMLMRLNRWLNRTEFKKLSTLKDSSSQEIFESIVYAVAGHDAYHPGVKNTEVCQTAIKARMNSGIQTVSENISFKADSNDYKVIDPSLFKPKLACVLEVVHSYITNSIIANSKDEVPDNIKKSAEKAVESIKTRSHEWTAPDKNSLVALEFIDSCITATEYMASTKLKSDSTEMTRLKDVDWGTAKVDDLKSLGRYFVITLDISNPGSNNIIESVRMSRDVMAEFGFASGKTYTACELVAEQELWFFKSFFSAISETLHAPKDENLKDSLENNHLALIRKLFDNKTPEEKCVSDKTAEGFTRFSPAKRVKLDDANSEIKDILTRKSDDIDSSLASVDDHAKYDAYIKKVICEKLALKTDTVNVAKFGCKA